MCNWSKIKVDIEDSSGTHLKNEVVGTNMVDEETSRLALSKQHAIIDNQQQDIQVYMRSIPVDSTVVFHLILMIVIQCRN